MQGVVFLKQGQNDRAIADFNEAVERDPNFAKAYCNRGVAYAQKGQFDQALADFQQGPGTEPQVCQRLLQPGGWPITTKGLYDKAIGDFNKCLELDPKLADAYFSKALALEAAGRQEEAREAYTAFLRYAPPEAKDQIEQARSKIGRR